MRIKYPPKQLNKNKMKGLHWSIIDEHRSDQKTEAFLLTKNALVDSPINLEEKPKLFIVWVITPPDRKTRDEDNLCFKGAQDGIFRALGYDDSNVDFTVRKMLDEPDPDKKGFVDIKVGIPDESFDILWR
jgi:hypothetical protein